LHLEVNVGWRCLSRCCFCRSGSEDIEAAEWGIYEFKPGQYFKYELTSGGKSGWYTLTVSDASDGKLKFEWEGEYDGSSFSSSVTAGAEEAVANMFMSMAMSPAAEVLLGTIWAQWWMPFFAGTEFSVGSGWSASWEGESVSFEVVSTETYAGVEGYVVEWRKNDELVSRVCVAPNVPLALKTEITDPGYSVEMVDYEPGN